MDKIEFCDLFQNVAVQNVRFYIFGISQLTTA